MAELQQVKLGQLHESPFNPRQKFDGLEELAESIRANGVIQPLIVRQVNGHLEIIAGARRFRAAKLAKQDTVPVLLRDLNDREAQTEQIIENLQRENISALEEAAGFKTLLGLGVPLTEVLRGDDERDKAKGGVEHLAKRIGKSARHVYARLKLLELAAPVQKALAAGKIEASHAQELVPLKPEQQKAMLAEMDPARSYDGKPPSVEEVRDMIAARFREKPAPAKLSAKEKARRARESAAEKKRQATYKAQQAKSAAERESKRQVAVRAAAALWPKLRKATKLDRNWLLRVTLEDFAQNLEGLGEALQLAAGKPLVAGEYYLTAPAAISRASATGELLPLVALAIVCEGLEWGDQQGEQIFKRFHVDRKAIAKQIQAEQKAAAVKAAKVSAAGKAAVKTLQTSAKSKAAARGKAKTKRAA